MRNVLVIGGGASGMMAAISAARAGASVTVLEQNKQIGKKILVTGNGRCNLTNVNQDLANYRSSTPGFAEQTLGAFSMEDTVDLFAGWGVYTRSRKGYLYPYSDQALAVAEALRMEAEHQKVKLALNTKVLNVEKKEGCFLVKTEGWEYKGDTLILAAGSCASPKTGSDGSGYGFARKLGHKVIKPLPALVALHSKDKIFTKLAGLRMDARVELWAEKTLLCSDLGEVQFTSYGISGIPVFQVSRYAVRSLAEGKHTVAKLDLMPQFSEEAFAEFMEKRIAGNGYKTLEQLLVGLFPKKMADCLLERTGLKKSQKAETLSQKERKSFVLACKNFRVEISGSNDFEQAQVCCGGVALTQVNPRTMESLLVPGLYFSGEILDVDGACGGYNLQWAWSSGYLAGMYAAGGRISAEREKQGERR